MEYNLKESAEMLNISVSTARRWVKNGKLPAEMKAGKYGMEYIVNHEGIEYARNSQRVPVIVTENKEGYPANSENIKTLITMAVKSAMVDMEEEISATRQEIRELKEEIKKRDNEHDKRLMEGIREIQKRQRENSMPWYKKIFKRHKKSL